MTAKIRIDNVDYDFPQVESLTLDEGVVLYELSGLRIDEVGDLPEGAFHPGFIKAMLYIAVSRARPELKRQEIESHLGGIAIAQMAEIFVDDEDDADPPPESQTGTDEPPVRSGETGTDGSENGQDSASRVSTGPPVLGASAGSGRLISAG